MDVILVENEMLLLTYLDERGAHIRKEAIDSKTIPDAIGLKGNDLYAAGEYLVDFALIEQRERSRGSPLGLLWLSSPGRNFLRHLARELAEAEATSGIIGKGKRLSVALLKECLSAARDIVVGVAVAKLDELSGS